MNDLPLAGRRILVTRAAHQASKLSQALRDLGADAVEVPVIEIAPPALLGPLDQAVRELGSYDWLILTSANAVRAVAGRALEQGIALDQPSSLRVAAIGSTTAEAAKLAGFGVALVPESYIAESLAVALINDALQHKRIVIARAAVARDVIPDVLRAAGAAVDVVEAYRNVLPECAPEQLRVALDQPIDAATFTSSSSVTHLAGAAEKAGIAFPLAGVPSISIGPVTSRTLREMAWPPAVQAQRSDIGGLVAAVVEHFGGRA